VGGDGTHSEIANAFLDPQGGLRSQAVLAPISRGTGGDLARTLGFPRDPEKALQALDLDRVASIDAGWIRFRDPQGEEKERVFLNVASLGIGGEVDLRVNRTSKALGGFASFLWATLATLLSYRPKQVRFSVDGGPWQEEGIILIAVANGQYFGGGMWVAPTATMGDGRFSVVLALEMGLLKLIAPLCKLYRGTHLGHPRVREIQARGLSVVSHEEVWLDIDGEPLGTLPATFTLLPRALRIAVGPGFSTGPAP
jgi:YegS/Rv2252/BmrU family lipid kinase